MSKGHHDQQTKGTNVDVPCPWCGKPQDLSALEIHEDAQVHCDECDEVYTLTSIVPEAKCPQCGELRDITAMELDENAVLACEHCHRVFRAAEAEVVTNVVAERAT